MKLKMKALSLAVATIAAGTAAHAADVAMFPYVVNSATVTTLVSIVDQGQATAGYTAGGATGGSRLHWRLNYKAGANATNNADDRTALQAEVTQLRQEIDRVAKTTSFNGTKLLDGSFANATFQVGANAGEGISIDSIVSAKTTSLGTTDVFMTAEITVANGASGAALAAVTAGTYSVNGVDLGALARECVGLLRSTLPSSAELRLAQPTAISAFTGGAGWGNLRALRGTLDAAGESGPYVLVSHSRGGLYSMIFAGLYKDEKLRLGSRAWCGLEESTEDQGLLEFAFRRGAAAPPRLVGVGYACHGNMT